MTVHVTIEMDEALKAKLDAFSSARGRASGELLVEAVERIAEEHDALSLAVDEARASLASGRSYTHEEVVAEAMARRRARARKA